MPASAVPGAGPHEGAEAGRGRGHDELVVRYLGRRHERWWEHLEHRLVDAPAPRALTLFDAYLDHSELDTDRGCAFIDAAAELRPDHPGLDVVRAHKRAVRDRLRELVAEPGPAASGDTLDDLGELLYLLLEGATAHLGLGEHDAVATARRLAAARLDDAGRA